MGSNEMMGHDPLAWIKETPAETEAEVSSEVVEATAIEPSEPTPPLEPAESEVAVNAEPIVMEPETVEEPEPAVVESVMEAPEPVVEPPAEAVDPVVQSEVVPATIEGQGTFELGEQLIISTVGKVRAEWMDQIVAGLESPVTLNGAHVESIDTAGLQLLVALIRELGEDGVSWEWGECSETLKSSAEQLGMREMISCV